MADVQHIINSKSQGHNPLAFAVLFLPVKHLSGILFLVCFLLLSLGAGAQHSHGMLKNDRQAPKTVYLLQMDTMMLHMDTVKLLHQADVDFLRLMIPHHQGAVAMALYEVAHGKNGEMIQLAKSIIAEQQIEIQRMEGLLSLQTSIKADNNLSKDWAEAMNTMMKNMPQEKELNDIDIAFAKVMLPHHQAGIDMAKVLLRNGKDRAVNRMAESIISSQQIEIEQMKHFIDDTHE